MTRGELEQLANGLHDFHSEFKLRLTETERQAIAKVAMTLDLLMYSMPQEAPDLLGNEFIMSGSQPVETETVRDCGSCRDGVTILKNRQQWCVMHNRKIGPFEYGCEHWRQK